MKLNIGKYSPFLSRVITLLYLSWKPAKYRNAWGGPRGKQTFGTGKAMARLMWDRARFA
ncbi:MAG TPA: hypothetical protein VFC07_01000 [Verrucomicrobiae bacterium]|nr:hypothetical protein [Verrucomicrobiae bacterium]